MAAELDPRFAQVAGAFARDREVSQGGGKSFAWGGSRPVKRAKEAFCSGYAAVLAGMSRNCRAVSAAGLSRSRPARPPKICTNAVIR